MKIQPASHQFLEPDDVGGYWRHEGHAQALKAPLQGQIPKAYLGREATLAQNIATDSQCPARDYHATAFQNPLSQGNKQ
jgi:hypothetical protein